MSSYIDIKYINLVSPLLKKFKWKSTSLANCRCSFCGDSVKSKTKARGYFFKKNNDFFFKCHNCGVGLNLYNFLEKMAPTLCKQYAIERYTKGENNKSNYIKPKVKDLYPVPSTIPKKYSYVPVSDLPEDHVCKKYLQTRKLDSFYDRFGYAENFATLAQEINIKYNNLFNEPRLVIPILDEEGKLQGIQGRILKGSKNETKYITIRINEDPLCYGIDRVNRNKEIIVVEGPIDSMFLDNAVGCLGSSNFTELENRFKISNATYVLDNEPRNKEIIKILEKLIKSNKKVCIWPEGNIFKDVNDMVLNDINVRDTIQNNTYSGLSAVLHLNKWRKT